MTLLPSAPENEEARPRDLGLNPAIHSQSDIGIGSAVPQLSGVTSHPRVSLAESFLTGVSHRTITPSAEQAAPISSARARGPSELVAFEIRPCRTSTLTRGHNHSPLKMESVRDALQPVLQPITHNLPGPIRDLGVSLIGDKCYSSLVLDIDVADEACLKLAVSKALGVGIVAASSVVKVPQIVNLARSRSASGVSFLSYLLETSSYLISLAYNVRNGFPFSTYGETALILGQNVVITVLVLNYSGRAGFAALFVAALAGAFGALFTEGILDAKTMGLLQAGAGTLGVASKLPQILAIWQEGGTGQLSAFTVSVKSGKAGDLCSGAIRGHMPRKHVLCGYRRLILLWDRSSTTCSARWHASSQHCRRWTTS